MSRTPRHLVASCVLAVQFRVADAMATGFGDDAFDAVLCNRLFHHLREPAIRRAVLVELSRICRGVLVVSFFRRESWDGAVFHAKNAFAGRVAFDRIPITKRALSHDVSAAGLVIKGISSTRPLISKQSYAVLSTPDRMN